MTGNAFGEGNAIDELHNLGVAFGKLWVTGQWAAGTTVPTIVWKSSDGVSFTQSNIDGMGDANNNGGFPVTIGFNDSLYFGCQNTTTGGQVWRTCVLPGANFSSSSTLVCPGDSVSFTNLSTCNASNPVWSFPGGSPSSSTAMNPIVVYNSQGVYDVTLVVSNNNGTDTLFIPGFISVEGIASQPGAILGDSLVCNNEVQNYSVNSVPGATSYSWTVPAGWTILTGQGTNNLQVNVGSAGGNLEVTSDNACGSSAPQILSVVNDACLDIHSFSNEKLKNLSKSRKGVLHHPFHRRTVRKAYQYFG